MAVSRIPLARLIGATAMALVLGGVPALSQTAQPVEPPAAVANDNQPLAAPDTPAKRAQVMPDSFADLVEQVSPAVVNITTTAVVSAPVARFPGMPENSPFSDLFREFGFPGMPDGFPGEGPEGAQRSNALGSGFVISADGFIVTNNHVIEGADEIEIEFSDGNMRAAEVIGTDPKTDIALLKVDATDLPFVRFGDSDAARVGDWVLALGNPLGQGFSASTGIVSARNRELQGVYDDFIQTDAAINRGNSGGPLFDMDGKVIGVNTAILSPNGGSIGIGFSMASNVVSRVVDQLREYGETRRGWLGVKIQDVTPEMADALGMDAARGAMVSDVPEGPALAAGMEPGDVIMRFAGSEIENSRDLVRRVAEAPVGEAVAVEVLRAGELREIEVTLGRRELAEGQGGASSVESAPAVSTDQVLGMALAPLTPEIAAELGVAEDQEGLVVREVDPAGVAAENGLAAGDLITRIGQYRITSIEELNSYINEAREAGRNSVLLMVRRAGEPRFVALPIGDE